MWVETGDKGLPQCFFFPCCPLILIWSDFKSLRSWNSFQHKQCLSSSQVWYKTINIDNRKCFGFFSLDRENTDRKSKEARKIFHTNLLTACCRVKVHYEQWRLCFSLKGKACCHFHLCNVHSKVLCATFHHVFLFLSNTEREENGNMNQWSHFPSHIQPQAEMISQAKQVWVAATFERWKSKGNLCSSESGADDSTVSIPTAKSIMNQGLCVMWLSLLGSFDFHKREWKSG